jgi:hypothetical protein
MVFLFDIIRKNSVHFETIGNRSFDIFKTIESVGRDQLLPMMTMVTMYNSGLKQFVNEQKAALFLDRITTTYKHEVQYHNDIHGSDVLQMAYYLLSSCKLL